MMIKALLKRRIKRTLISLGLYPDESDPFTRESAWWKPAQPDWARILRSDSALWKSALAGAIGGPRVLLATSIGGFPPNTIVDSMLAVALTLRGAEVHILLCDAALPACFVPASRHFPDTEAFVKHGPSRRVCGSCFPPGHKMFRSLGLPIHRFSKFVSRQELKSARELSASLPSSEIAEFRLDGIPVGEQAVAGALRFYARGNLDGEPHGEAILRRYFNASLVTFHAIRRLMKTWEFACVTSVHGVYVPHGLIPELARQEKVRSVSWSPTYRKHTFIFSHHDTYHRTMLSEPMTNWETMNWTPEMEAEILQYLKSRRYGTRDWISYVDNPNEDTSAIADDLGIDFSKPSVGLLTNVMWDAQVNYRGNAFPNVLEWVLETIRYFTKRDDLQLIVRVHPAEIRGLIPSRQPIIDEIKKAFPTLPDNVFIVPPDSAISTYALMLKCNAALIYATKMGVELTSLGIPVIVAGEAWIRNKGVTLDASSSEEYFELLEQLPLKKRLDDAVAERARKYAYHFFFRRMIPLPFLAPSSHMYKLELSGIEALLPGNSVGLDVICNGILKGDKFIYPAERNREVLDHTATKK